MFLNIPSLIGGAVAAAIAIPITLAFPQSRYMTVHDISYEAGQVYAERTVHRVQIADWRVTIVSAEGEAPICNTIPGPAMHQGWSEYSEGRLPRQMSLDVWVGQEGCLSGLTPGLYNMHTTWTPRDGTRPVFDKSEILVTAADIEAAQEG